MNARIQMWLDASGHVTTYSYDYFDDQGEHLGSWVHSPPSGLDDPGLCLGDLLRRMDSPAVQMKLGQDPFP